MRDRDEDEKIERSTNDTVLYATGTKKLTPQPRKVRVLRKSRGVSLLMVLCRRSELNLRLVDFAGSGIVLVAGEMVAYWAAPSLT